MKERVLAKLVVNNIDDMTDQNRMDISDWLREKAYEIEYAKKGVYSNRWTARYIITKDDELDE